MQKYLLIDNYDSFTYNVVELLNKCNIDVEVVQTNKLGSIEVSNYLAIIISPGPNHPRDYPHLYKFIDKWCDKKPILGICLGFQIIADYFGSNIDYLLSPNHGCIKKLYIEKKERKNYKKNSYNVTLYHSIYVSKLGNSLIQTSKLENGLCMALKHQNKLIWRVQFHPESIGSNIGTEYINNFASAVEGFYNE